MTSVEYCSQCPECQSKIILDYGKGEYVCNKCGCVVMEQVDYYGPEITLLILKKEIRALE